MLIALLRHLYLTLLEYLHTERARAGDVRFMSFTTRWWWRLRSSLLLLCHQLEFDNGPSSERFLLEIIRDA